MEKQGFGILAIAIALALCVGCTQTFEPENDAGAAASVGDGVGALDTVDVDGPGWDFTGLETPGADTPGVDTPTADTAQPPVMGPLFRVWITGGASASKNDEVRIIGGIRPESGVPSGDGAHWLIPVFRAGPTANDS